MKSVIAAVAVFAAVAYAEEEGCGPCGQVPLPVPAPFHPIPSKDCLGVCQCPYGSTKQWELIDGQTQCQEVIEVGCRVPNTFLVKGVDDKEPGVPVAATEFEGYARQVCVSTNILIRPFCKLPVYPVNYIGLPFHPNEYEKMIEAASKQDSVQYVLVEQPDGSVKLVARVLREDCNHYCPEGFYFAEESLSVQNIDQELDEGTQ